MTKSNERRQLDRRVVEPIESLGFLEHESFGTAVKIVEQSSGGFTVSIAPDKAALFPGGDDATLTIGQQSYTVMISGYYREGNRKSHLGLKRVSTTEPPKRNTHRFSAATQKKSDCNSREKFTYGLFMALFLAIFALPGIGDWLGTAPWLRSLIQNSVPLIPSATHITSSGSQSP